MCSFRLVLGDGCGSREKACMCVAFEAGSCTGLAHGLVPDGCAGAQDDEDGGCRYISGCLPVGCPIVSSCQSHQVTEGTKQRARAGQDFRQAA